MDKILTSLQTLLPLVAFYPRWVQLLFLGTFSMFLVSVLLFVVLYSQAAELKRSSDAAREIAPAARQKIDADLHAAAVSAAELGLAISNYHASAVALQLHLADYGRAHPNPMSYISTPLPPPLRQDTEDTLRKLEALQAALAAIQRHEFAAACWRRAAQRPSVWALRHVRDMLRRDGFSDVETMLDIADLANLTQFVGIAAGKLRPLTFEPLVSAALRTNAADVPAVGQAYDHAALRSLVFAGNLLFNHMDRSRARPTEMFSASWGTAILVDLYKTLPDADVVREELRARFPHQQAAIDALDIRVATEHLLGGDFRLAVAELEKRPGLLVLQIR